MTARNRARGTGRLRVLGVAVLCLLAAASVDAATERVMVLGDSWPMFMVKEGASTPAPITQALENKGLLVGWYSGAGGETVAIGGSEIVDWAGDSGPAVGALARAVRFLQERPTIDMIILTLGGNDFLGRWSPTLPPEDEEQIWFEALYGADGLGGLKKIIDTLLAVRPDVKIIFSSYDYIGGKDSRTPDMASVQAYNEASETFSQIVIDFIDDNYKSPARAFFVNNLGLMQYTYGYPGPDPETIPAYFWPDGPPATPQRLPVRSRPRRRARKSAALSGR